MSQEESIRIRYLCTHGSNHLRFSEREDRAGSIDNTGAHLVNSRTSCTDNTMVGILLFSSADADSGRVGILHKKLKRKVDRRLDFAWTRIDLLALDGDHFRLRANG